VCVQFNGVVTVKTMIDDSLNHLESITPTSFFIVSDICPKDGHKSGSSQVTCENTCIAGSRSHECRSGHRSTCFFCGTKGHYRDTCSNCKAWLAHKGLKKAGDANVALTLTEVNDDEGL
jgi:hypothetical protein